MNRIYFDFDWAQNFLENIFSHQDIINISMDNGSDKIAEIDRICKLNQRSLLDLEIKSLNEFTMLEEISFVIKNDDAMQAISSKTISELSSLSDMQLEGSCVNHYPEKANEPEDDLFRNDD